MDYIKLFRKYNGEQNACAQIYTRSYGCSLEYILNLVSELRKDFPSITHRDIQVQKYGGQRIKGIVFVEVSFPDNTEMPEGYEEIQTLEYVL